jgi:AcrR family transcriptional regulator
MRGDESAGTVVRRGRYAEAERNDAAILESARDVFLADPTAPISAVAKRAGVGMGALYHRYAGKEDLLATLCLQGQDRYLAEVRDALGVASDPWEAYVGFLRRIVAADTHSLVVRLAGTFTPTAEHLARAEQMEKLGTQLFERARATGKLRADVTFMDVSFLLELIAKSSLDSPERTSELRQRQLAIVIDGLAAVHAEPLPGAPPTWHEQQRRWG